MVITQERTILLKKEFCGDLATASKTY